MADYSPYASFKAQSHLAQQQQQQNQYTNTYAPQQQQQTQTEHGGGYQAGYPLYRLGEEPTTTAQSQQYPASANSNSHSTLLSSLAPLANNSTSNSSTTNPSSNMAMATSNTPTPAAIAPPTALLWTDLEPWMDAEYARQVCALMRWEAAVIVPSPPNSLNINGGARDGGANNAGYAVLTFATAAGASRALAQVGCSSLVMSFTLASAGRVTLRLVRWPPTEMRARFRFHFHVFCGERAGLR
jgi:hypothetical protein